MNKLLVKLTAALTIGLLSACANPGKVTGGGSLIGNDGKQIAKLGFHGDTCDGDLNNPKGHFNYVDQKNNVKMNGDLLSHGACVSRQEWQGNWISTECLLCETYLTTHFHFGYANYRSTNPNMPGEGQVLTCVKDYGEGENAEGSDEFFVFVDSGPFAGYQQIGTIQGNIQDHTCDE